MNSSPNASLSPSQKSTASGLLDQTALSELAQRLVEAAKRAGADAADAIAVRGVSQGVEIREGKVEESERSEGDDIGLRVFVGKRQAVVSSSDIGGDVAKLAERAVAMAKVSPDDEYVGLADPALLARQFPDLDLLDPQMPSVAELERRALEAEAAALAVKGVSKSGGSSASSGIGGMVLVTSTGFHGSYLRSSQSVSAVVIAGEGTGMERDYDFTSAIHGSDLEPASNVGKRAGERTVARLNPRKVATCKAPVVFDPRVSNSLVGHLVGAVNGASIARKTSFLKDRLGQQLFDKSIRIIDDPLRVRGMRSQAFDSDGVATKKLAIIDEGVAGAEGQGTRPSLTPYHAGTVWSTWQLTSQWRFGVGLNFRGRQTPLRNPGWEVPAYVTTDLMAEYKASDKFVLKANLSNVSNALYANELYTAHYIPGAGRLLQITGSLKFQ